MSAENNGKHFGTVTMAPRGEVVDFQGEPKWLLSDCGLENVAYVCLTHQLDFPTKHHFQLHAAEPGEHSVVRWCPRHGLEAVTPKEAKSV